MRDFPFVPYLAGFFSVLLGICMGYFLGSLESQSLTEDKLHELTQNISKLERLLIVAEQYDGDMVSVSENTDNRLNLNVEKDNGDTVPNQQRDNTETTLGDRLKNPNTSHSPF